MMDMPEVEKAFGAALAFELRAVFCDTAGPNLRNVLAHGLLDDAEIVTASSVYAWWFCLRLAMMPFLKRKPDGDGDAPKPENHDEAAGKPQ